MCVGDKRSVWCDVGARGDGGWVTNGLANLLSLVDLAYFFGEEGITFLADLDDLGTFSTPSFLEVSLCGGLMGVLEAHP